MNKFQESVNLISTYPWVDEESIKAFNSLFRSQTQYLKSEGALCHICSFFLPYDKGKGMIYLGHHIKADDWIPPGGHIEPGESPIEAAIREMKEELKVSITADMVTPWNLSVKEIGRPEKGCEAHYDIWHLVNIPVQDFDFDRGEYYDARWFSINEGATQIAKNPDFADIVRLLSA